jgi:hypothetical protein
VPVWNIRDGRAVHGAMRTVVVLLTVLASACGGTTSSAAPRASPADGASIDGDVDVAQAERRFRDWIVARGAAEGLTVDAWWSDDLDLDGTPDRIAKLCRAGDTDHAWYVVETAGAARHVAEHASWGHSSVCPSDEGVGEPRPLPAWGTAAQGSIALIQSGKRGDYEEKHVAVRDGALVSIFDASAGQDHPDPDDNHVVHMVYGEYDWERGVRFTLREPFDSEGFWARDEAAALVPVAPAGATWKAPVWTEVIAGRAWWRGAEDAALSIRAERWARGITVTVELTDDRMISLAPSASADESDVDELTLRWCVPVRGNGDRCVGADAALREVRVTFDDQGGIAGRSWGFDGADDVVPPLRSPRRGVVELTLELDEREVLGTIPFAAEFVDRDGGHDVSTIASARVHHGDVASLGALIMREEGSRWPVAGRRVIDGETIIAPDL